MLIFFLISIPILNEESVFYTTNSSFFKKNMIPHKYFMLFTAPHFDYSILGDILKAIKLNAYLQSGIGFLTRSP